MFFFFLFTFCSLKKKICLRLLGEPCAKFCRSTRVIVYFIFTSVFIISPVVLLLLLLLVFDIIIIQISGTYFPTKVMQLKTSSLEKTLFYIIGINKIKHRYKCLQLDILQKKKKRYHFLTALIKVFLYLNF